MALETIILVPADFLRIFLDALQNPLVAVSVVALSGMLSTVAIAALLLRRRR